MAPQTQTQPSPQQDRWVCDFYVYAGIALDYSVGLKIKRRKTCLAGVWCQRTSLIENLTLV